MGGSLSTSIPIFIVTLQLYYSCLLRFAGRAAAAEPLLSACTGRLTAGLEAVAGVPVVGADSHCVSAVNMDLELSGVHLAASVVRPASNEGDAATARCNDTRGPNLMEHTTTTPPR